MRNRTHIILKKGVNEMMKKLLALCLVFTVIVSAFVSAQVQYGNLEGRNYDPKIDPNIDMFISLTPLGESDY